MDKIRVLLLVHALTMGGSERCTLQIAKHLDKRIFEPIVYTIYTQPIFFKRFIKANDIRVAEGTSVENEGIISGILSFIEKERIDIVHYQFSGDSDGKASIYRDIPERLVSEGIPVIETVRSIIRGNNGCLSNLCVSKAAAAVQSPYQASKVIYEGTDIRVFDRRMARRRAVRKRLGIPSDSFIVGYAGRFAKDKGIDHFIKIAQSMQSIVPSYFVAVGCQNELSGEQLESVEKNRLLIMPPSEELEDYLSAFDVLFFPSRYDAMPNSVIEAMASGVPVVAYDTGGIREIIEEGQTGFLIRINDIEGADKKIAALLLDSRLRHKMSMNCRKRICRMFDIRRNIREIEQEYIRGINSPLVSVIMPTYNHRDYIRDAIISVKDQTYRRWELIIVDDGSTDRTQEHISKMVTDDPRIRYYRNPQNMGIAASRNIALGLSRGAYIAHLDSDDVLHKEALSETVSVFNDKPDIKLVYTDYENMNKENESIGICRSAPSIINKNLFPGWHHFGIYEKKAAQEIKGFNEFFDTCEDGDLALRIAERYTTYHLDKVLYRRRIHGKNISYRIASGCQHCHRFHYCPYHNRYSRIMERQRNSEKQNYIKGPVVSLFKKR